ncbi:MAG: four helix bundle protein [Crocinitomicaceae bacterium]
MHNFRNLNIWKRSLEFSIEILDLVKKFPSDQRFEISSQMNRSAISIPSNIAEGSVRTTNKEFRRFLDFALGSAFELETQLIIASRTIDLEQDLINNKITELQEIQKMIKAFKELLN